MWGVMSVLMFTLSFLSFVLHGLGKRITCTLTGERPGEEVVGFKKKYNIVFRQVFFILQNTCSMIFLLPSLPSPFSFNHLIHR